MATSANVSPMAASASQPGPKCHAQIPAITAVIDKWQPLFDVAGNTPVGTISADINRGGEPTGSDRGVESPAGNLVADAQRWATSANGADVAFMMTDANHAATIVDPTTLEDCGGRFVRVRERVPCVGQGCTLALTNNFHFVKICKSLVPFKERICFEHKNENVLCSIGVLCATPLPQPRQRFARQHQGGRDVDGEKTCPESVVELAERAGRDRSRVVHENVDPIAVIAQPRDRVSHFVQRAQVELEERRRPASEGLDLLQHRRRPRL